MYEFYISIVIIDFFVLFIITRNYIRMSPPELSTISANSTGISNGATIYLGKNLTVASNSTTGLTTLLPVSISNILTISKGININNINGTSKLTINDSGDIQSSGLINVTGSITTASSLNSTSINVNTNKFTVSDAGVVTTASSITADGNLAIGSKYLVTALTGDTLAGSITSTGSVFIGGTTASPNVTLGNDGTISAINDLKINTDKFVVTAATGAIATKGDLTINSNKFIVSSSSGNVSVAGTMTIASDLAIATDKFKVTASSGNVTAAGTMSISGAVTASSTMSVASDFTIATNKFKVTASSGNVTAAGTMSIASDLAIATDKFKVTASSGNVAIAGDLAVTGKATSAIAYSSYTLADSATNITTTSASGTEPSCISATSGYLTTQEYVDKQIWNQTKRINTILGTDSTVVDSFNNVYKLVTSFAGVSDTVDTLNNLNGKYDTLVDRAEEINTSVSTIVSQAYNTILVNCTPTVWQDECGPVPIPSTVTAYTIEDGWYFKNFTALEKINWYMPTNGSNMTIADLQNMYLNIFAVSNANLPFITIYTAPKDNTTDYSTWAGAKINYIFSETSSISTSANKSYCLYTQNKPMNVYNKTCVAPTGVQTANKTNKDNGTQGSQGSTIDSTIVSSTDKILLITIQTTANSTVGDVAFVLNSLNICVKTGTTSFTFSNAGVTTNYLFNYLFQKNIDFSTYPSATYPKQGVHVTSFDSIYNSGN